MNIKGIISNVKAIVIFTCVLYCVGSTLKMIDDEKEIELLKKKLEAPCKIDDIEKSKIEA